ncbi:hypothetical protein AURDEDRAFT_182748 [Auricularia subglabra TFB-10046 SS5]|nr:hypothetical protein AURDEDRAFT_182748 [Auricularia subglabra TFB-10046 SS5]
MARTRKTESQSSAAVKNEEEDVVLGPPDSYAAPDPRDTIPKKMTKLEESGIKCSARLNSLIDAARNEGISFDTLNISLRPDELAHPVSRAFISTHYGGSRQGGRILCHNGALGDGKHVLFGYMQPWNPYMPSRPGDPGLYFDGSPNLDADIPGGIRYTFVRLVENHWLYIGNYRMVNVAQLSVEEWLLQHEQCKKNWMDKIRVKTWGRIIRRSIAARKQFRTAHERDPTFGELVESMNDVPGNRVANMGVEEIRRAYDDGDELLMISALQFVGYDEAFQREITAKSHGPDAFDAEEKKPAKRELEEDTIAARVQSRQRRRTARY